MALKIFLKLTDIKGESTDSKHKDEIVVHSWDWGMAQQVLHAGGGGGGSGVGKASFEDLHFTHQIDKASPLIMLACASGKHIRDATLTVRRAGKTPQEFLIVKLKDVLVTSVDPAVNDGTDGSQESATESVTLNFAQVDLEYKPQKADGSLGPGIHFAWNLQSNKPI